MGSFAIVNQINLAGVRIVEETPAPNKWADCVPVASVGPEGQFNVTFFDRQMMRKGEPIKQGLTPVTYDPEQGIGIARWAKGSGYVLYEDLCKGRIEGVDASSGHWTIWESVRKLFAAGRAPQRGALEAAAKKLGLDSIFHPEVERRREMVARGGLFALGVDELLAVMGFDGDAVEEDELMSELARASEPAV